MYHSDDKVVIKRRGSSPLSSAHAPGTRKNSLGYSSPASPYAPASSSPLSKGLLHVNDDSLKSYMPNPEVIDAIADPQLVEYKLHLIESLNEGVAIIDTDQGAMRIASVNRGFERITGWKGSEVQGSTLNFLQGSATNEKGVETVLMGLEQKRHVRVLLVSYRRNRTTFWNSIYTVPLPPQPDSKERRYVAVVMTDVTEWYEKEGVSRDSLHSPGRLTGVQAPRPRMQSPAIPHSKPMAKKMDDVSIICINFVRIHEFLDSFSDSSVAMKLMRDLMEMVDSSLAYFPSIRKVKMSGSGFVAIGGIPLPERAQDPLQQAMKRRLPPRRSTASETDLQVRVERMEREWYELLGHEDEEEDSSMRRTLSGSEVAAPPLEDLLDLPNADPMVQSSPFPEAPMSQSYPQSSMNSSSPASKFKAFSSPLPTGHRRRGNSAPAKPILSARGAEEEASNKTQNGVDQNAQDPSSLFYSAMQSSASVIPEEPKESKKKMSSVKKKLMMVKERRDKIKEKQKEKDKEKENQKGSQATGTDKPWQQIEPKGIEKLKELDKESKRNRKNKALEEMAAFALTVIFKFSALSESVLKVERRKVTQIKATTRERSGSLGSRCEAVPADLSLKIGMHIGRAMVGSLPLSLISPTPAGSLMQSLPEVWGETLEIATDLCRSAYEGKALVSAAVYERICHKFRCSETDDKKNYHLDGYRVK